MNNPNDWYARVHFDRDHLTINEHPISYNNIKSGIEIGASFSGATVQVTIHADDLSIRHPDDTYTDGERDAANNLLQQLRGMHDDATTVITRLKTP